MRKWREKRSGIGQKKCETRRDCEGKGIRNVIEEERVKGKENEKRREEKLNRTEEKN